MNGLILSFLIFLSYYSHAQNERISNELSGLCTHVNTQKYRDLERIIQRKGVKHLNGDRSLEKISYQGNGSDIVLELQMNYISDDYTIRYAVNNIKVQTMLNETPEGEIYHMFPKIYTEIGCFYSEYRFSNLVESFREPFETNLFTSSFHTVDNIYAFHVPWKIFAMTSYARIIGALHDMDYVHGNVNLTNMYIRRLSEVVISGFEHTQGIASIVQYDYEPWVDYDNNFMENPYISIEMQEGKYTRKSDVYGLGVAFHQLWTNKRYSKSLPEHNFSKIIEEYCKPYADDENFKFTERDITNRIYCRFYQELTMEMTSKTSTARPPIEKIIQRLSKIAPKAIEALHLELDYLRTQVSKFPEFYFHEETIIDPENPYHQSKEFKKQEDIAINNSKYRQTLRDMKKLDTFMGDMMREMFNVRNGEIEFQNKWIGDNEYLIKIMGIESKDINIEGLKKILSMQDISIDNKNGGIEEDLGNKEVTAEYFVI